jgi:hypothetical protein
MEPYRERRPGLARRVEWRRERMERGAKKAEGKETPENL